MKRINAADGQCANGVVWERGDGRSSEAREPVENVRSRHGAEELDSPGAMSQTCIHVWLPPKKSQSTVCSGPRLKPLSVAVFSRRVTVTAGSITGRGPIAFADMRRECLQEQEAYLGRGARRRVPRARP